MDSLVNLTEIAETGNACDVVLTTVSDAVLPDDVPEAEEASDGDEETLFQFTSTGRWYLRVNGRAGKTFDSYEELLADYHGIQDTTDAEEITEPA
jgi:hypothetical protein